MLELNTKKFPTIIEVVINGEVEKYTDLSFYTSEITDNWQNFLEVIVLEYNYKLHLIIIDENSKLHNIEIRD
jgi:hypothetical protein